MRIEERQLLCYDTRVRDIIVQVVLVSKTPQGETITKGKVVSVITVLMKSCRWMNMSLSDPVETSSAWDSMTHEQKNHLLYLKQKSMLDMFLEHGAISQAQHDKSLHDLTEKMGESE